MASTGTAKQGVSLMSNGDRFLNGFGGGQESILVSGTMGLPATDSSLELTYQAAIAKHRRGDLAGAEQDYRNILVAQPDHAGAWHFLGMLFFARHQTIEALAFLEKALQLCATKAVYHNNYGVVLKSLGRLNEAETAFQKSVAINPDYADARSNLGSVRLIRNDLKQAESELETALKLQPEHPDAQKHLGELRFRQGNFFADHERFDDAARAFHQAASLPEGQELWRWKPLNFCPSLFSDENSIERYWTHLNEGLDQALNRNIPVRREMLPRDGFTPSFNLPHLRKCCRDVKEKFSKLFEKAFDDDCPTLKNTMRDHSRIRVGFVATAGHHRGFLRVHRHLLEHLDPKKFDVFFFCPQPILDSCRQTVQNNNIRYVGLPDRFDVAVTALLESRCDILYHWKVGGGTLDYFLAMAKAAPVQCTSLGTHGTGGVKAVDYYLSTSYLESPDSANQYTEQLVLFGSYATSHPHEQEMPAVSRSELGLPESGAIYFCPHRLPKYHPCIDHYFRLILEGDPTGLLLLCAGKKKPLADLFAERLRRSLGSELFRRVRLAPALPLEVYKKHLTVATCVLDSPVYAGDLTTHDAFCQGVPVVTQEGELLIQRYTSGLYRTMELESLIATDAEDYARVAVRLGTDSDYREDIHRKILERNSYIFSPMDTVRDYENFFERVCSDY